MLALAACHGGAPAGTMAGPMQGSDASVASDAAVQPAEDAMVARDAAPLAWTPPDTPRIVSPLTDQSRSLEELLEKGTLSQSDCDKYFAEVSGRGSPTASQSPLASDSSRETTLRCGKWMFFYAHLEVPGSPAELVDLIRNNAPDSVGKSLEKLGLFPDPYSQDGLPVGLTNGPNLPGGVPTYTLSCGSCHFGQTPDGRYVVGSPNHHFEFGKFTLSVSTMPSMAASLDQTLAPEVEAAVGPIRDEVFGNPLTRLSVLAQAVALLPTLLTTEASPPDDAAKLALALYPAGVMDPYAPPSLDDGVHIPVRMSPLWGINPDAMTQAGSTHGAMLGSNGGAPDLQHILRTFAFIAGQIRGLPLGAQYDPAKLEPLIQYIMSLNPPAQEQTLDQAQVSGGRELFHERCARCHEGPGLASVKVFDVQEIGTDPNISQLVDSDGDGKAIYDVLTPPEITKGIRARRLSAVWSLSRLFHNGSASSLADVFCLNGPRAQSTRGAGYSTAGHMFTCDGLSDDQKRSLIAFLQSR
jgi:hypothetical protein